MQNNPQNILHRAINLLSSPAILFFTLPWLMVLLTLGTVAQKDIGIHAAQTLYFGSWIFMMGPIPLPGGILTIFAITLCLITKFIFKSPWNFRQSGIILTHLGILILLIGGGVTALTQNEGFISIKEGDRSNFISDYMERELAILKNEQEIYTASFKNFDKENVIGNENIPFKILIESICKNCLPVKTENTDNRHGLAQKVILTSTTEEKEPEANLSGMTFIISGTDKKQDGIYAVMEEIPHKPEITIDNDTYTIQLRRKKEEMPFSIELKEFTRNLHPGTDMASGFSSGVVIHDNGVEWPSVISMNEPLRYKGFTFYQTSFSLRPDGEYSILSVVRNKGRAFPYVSGVILTLGLILHIIIRLKSGRKKVL